MADLVKIVEESDDPWFCGEYGWVFEHVRPLQSPIPYRGALQLFEMPLSVVATVLPVERETTLKEWIEQDQVLAECVKRGVPVEVGQRYLEVQWKQ